MKNGKVLMTNACKGLASVAFVASIVSASTNCLFVYHQPKAPEGLQKLKRS